MIKQTWGQVVGLRLAARHNLGAYYVTIVTHTARHIIRRNRICIAKHVHGVHVTKGTHVSRTFTKFTRPRAPAHGHPHTHVQTKCLWLPAAIPSFGLTCRRNGNYSRVTSQRIGPNAIDLSTSHIPPSKFACISDALRANFVCFFPRVLSVSKKKKSSLSIFIYLSFDILFDSVSSLEHRHMII